MAIGDINFKDLFILNIWFKSQSIHVMHGKWIKKLWLIWLQCRFERINKSYKFQRVISTVGRALLHRVKNGSCKRMRMKEWRYTKEQMREMRVKLE